MTGGGRRIDPSDRPGADDAPWASGVIVLAGLWLVLSAFMFVDLDVRQAGAWNSLAVGVVLALVGTLHAWVGLDIPGVAWLYAALGAWITASPLLFDYAANAAQTWNSLIVGFIVVIVAPATAGARRAPHAETLLEASPAPDYRGMGPRGWRPSDEQIRDAVCARMADHPDLDATDVEVAVHGAEVTLHGSVPSRAAKRLAEDLADSVAGVVDVHNALRIQPREAREISRAA
jgi:hypothetical protein